MLQSEKPTNPADKGFFNECCERIHFMARLNELRYSKGEFTDLNFHGAAEEDG
jgi:two-component sensor histidine kinase